MKEMKKNISVGIDEKRECTYAMYEEFPYLILSEDLNKKGSQFQYKLLNFCELKDEIEKMKDYRIENELTSKDFTIYKFDSYHFKNDWFNCDVIYKSIPLIFYPEVVSSCDKYMCFHIAFINGETKQVDQTSFDVVNDERCWRDELIQLFADFCKENDIKDFTIIIIELVPYETES